MTYTMIVNRQTATSEHGYALPGLTQDELWTARLAEQAKTAAGDTLELNVIED